MKKTHDWNALNRVLSVLLVIGMLFGLTGSELSNVLAQEDDPFWNPENPDLIQPTSPPITEITPHPEPDNSFFSPPDYGLGDFEKQEKAIDSTENVSKFNTAEAAILYLLNQYNNNLAQGNDFFIHEIHISNEYAYAIARNENNNEEYFGILAMRNEENNWIAVCPMLFSEVTFNEFLDQMPINFIDEYTKAYLSIYSGSNDEISIANFSGYYLPWQNGTLAMVTTKDGTSAGFSHESQIDFNIDNDIIYAPKGGTVVYVKDCSPDPAYPNCDNWRLANAIVIDHHNGQYSWFIHIAYGSSMVSVGQNITNGVAIAREGRTGCTGGTTGIHLHYMASSSVPSFPQSCDPYVLPWPTAASLQKVDFYEISWSGLVVGSKYLSSNLFVNPNPPATPAGVSATDGTYYDKIRVSWNSVPNTTYYQIYWNTSNNSSTSTLIGNNISSTYYDVSIYSSSGNRYFWVKACNNNGCSGFSASDVGYAAPYPPPPPPSSVSASDGTYTNKIRITWSSVSSAQWYNLYRSTNTTQPSTPYAWDLTTTYYDDTWATEGVIYYYWVRSFNVDGGQGNYSNYDTGWRAYAHNPPTGVSASDGIYSDKIRITWNSISGATSYKIFRATSNSSASATQLTTASITSFDDTTAVAGQTYYYWVKACSTSGCSNFSSSDSGWRLLGIPSAVLASDGSYEEKVRITWNSVSGATTYQVFRLTNNTSSSAVQIATTSSNNYEDTSAIPHQTYYYWVKACSSAGCSSFSSSDSGWSKLTKPIGLSASVGNYADKIFLNWEISNGATSYKIYRHTTDSSSSSTLIATTSSNSYDDLTATPDVNYYYWVKACNIYGCGDLSYSVMGYRSPFGEPQTPIELSASDGTFSYMVKVDWDHSNFDEIEYFELWRNTVNNINTAEIIANDIYGSYFNDYNSEANLNYFYWVKACNIVGCSDYSNADVGWRTTFPSVPNDDFSNATPITSTPYSNNQDISGATSASDDPFISCLWGEEENENKGYKTVWYRFSPSSDGVLEIFTSNTYGTTLAVFTGTRENLTPQACNEDYLYFDFENEYDRFGSFVNLTVYSGMTYYILVSGDNYEYYGPLEISAWFHNLKPESPSDFYASDGWYPDRIRISWNYSPGATHYEVWRNTIDNKDSADLIDDHVLYNPYSNYWNGYFDYAVDPEVNYYYWIKACNIIGCSDFSTSEIGWQRDWEIVLNDEMSNAIIINSMPYSNSQYIDLATENDNDPEIPCMGWQGGKTVWYRYTPTLNGIFKVNTFGSDFDTVLAIWTGYTGNLTSIACNDLGGDQSQIEISINKGITYYIEVASWGEDEFGSLKFSSSFTPDLPISKVYKSTATYDGWVLESTRTSSKGGSMNASSTTLRVGDDKTNRQYRSILHFNTADLPDNAIITSVQLKVKRYGYTGTSPFKTHGSLYVDMRKGAYSGKSALQLADWQATSSKSAAGRIPSTSTSYWHTMTLNKDYFNYINKSGVTQLRLRFSKQDNGDKGADYVSFYSGNASSSNRPQLIIKYYMP